MLFLTHVRPGLSIFCLATTMEGVERLAPDARLLPRPLDSHRPLRIPTPKFPSLPLLRYLPPADRGLSPDLGSQGKTSLVRRMLDKSFREDYVQTLGFDISVVPYGTYQVSKSIDAVFLVLLLCLP